MSTNPSYPNTSGVFWKILLKLFGKPAQWKQSESLLQELENRLQHLSGELEKVKNERLEWQAKEATTRKDLQDAKDRAKDLLDQVVRLTHQQRDTQKSLLDQQFKTATTPLERNRFEMEIAQAREKQRTAEERVKQIEIKLAHLKRLEQEARRVKELESKLSWEKQQTFMHLQAVRATVSKVQELESHLYKPTKPKPATRSRISKPLTRSKEVGTKRTYHKPTIRRTSSNQIQDLPVTPEKPKKTNLVAFQRA